MTSDDEVRLDHRVRTGKSLIDLARAVIALKGKIVTERGMNHGSRRIQRGAHVRHSVELFIPDRNVLCGVLGRGAAGRYDRRDGFALPAYAVNRDRALRRGFEA